MFEFIDSYPDSVIENEFKNLNEIEKEKVIERVYIKMESGITLEEAVTQTKKELKANTRENNL